MARADVSWYDGGSACIGNALGLSRARLPWHSVYMELHEGITYRLAYGQASELAASGGTLEQALAEVLRRLALRVSTIIEDDLITIIDVPIGA